MKFTKNLKKIKCVITSVLLISIMQSCSNSPKDYQPQENSEGMVAIENIMTRVSVRQYTGQAVPDDTIGIMLKAAMAAPSAKNEQPWEFVVLKDQAKRDEVAEKLQNIGDKAKTAGAVILICGNTERFIEGAPEYWVQDCSAATENLLLAAHALGLGAVWCGIYPVEERVSEIRRILSLPSHLVPLNVITIGYPTVIEQPKDKWDASKIITI